jgi:hypothetical protein
MIRRSLEKCIWFLRWNSHTGINLFSFRVKITLIQKNKLRRYNLNWVAKQVETFTFILHLDWETWFFLKNETIPETEGISCAVLSYKSRWRATFVNVGIIISVNMGQVQAMFSLFTATLTRKERTISNDSSNISNREPTFFSISSPGALGLNVSLLSNEPTLSSRYI